MIEQELKDGRITLLFDNNGMTIKLYDNMAKRTFVEVRLDPRQTCQALSRLGYTECKITVADLDIVGKTRISKPFAVSLGKKFSKANKTYAAKVIKDKCPEGWTPSLYLDSQGSIRKDDDGVYWAHTTIYKWK